MKSTGRPGNEDSSLTPKNTSADLEFSINCEIPPAIPDGDQYQAVFVRAEKSSFRKKQKIYLWFRLITPGDWLDTEFYMACSEPAKGCKAASCKYWLAWVLAAGRRPTRADRMSTAIFKGKVFRVRMRTVIITAKQLNRTPAQQYSVVDELLEVMVGK